MRGIAKLIFGGTDDRDEERLPGLLGGDDDWFRLADEARRTGEWCGTTPGRGAPRQGRVPRPVSAPDFWPR